MRISAYRPYLAVAILLGVSIVVHFAWFGWPNSAVFDEVHFGKFISAYFTHQYYFDIHPPLGKLIIAGWGWLWGYQPGFSFANIGELYPDRLYMALRFLPSLAGVLLPLVIYGIARRLRLSTCAAFLAGMLVALDNALLVQSRFILLDAFLLLFGFSAVWCYLQFSTSELPTADFKRRMLWLVAAGVLGGMTMSIKWTGMTFLALVVVLEIIRLWRLSAKDYRAYVTSFLCLIIIPILLYCSVFALHFALLTKTGAGDAFMSQRFQHGLEGNQFANDSSLRPLTLGEKIVQLNIEMYRSNQRLSATHPYSSSWFTWPLMLRPIFYWVQGTARIYLIGNPFIWWLSFVAVLWLFIDLVVGGIRNSDATIATVLGAWLMNMLPFVGITRVMFLYHYLTALVWAILALAIIVDRLLSKPKKPVFAMIVIACVVFAFFAPLSYGLSLSDRAYHARTWLNSWQ